MDLPDGYVSIKDRLPKKAGHYKCLVLVGSISPKLVCILKPFVLRPAFSYFYAGDWETVLAWKENNE